VNSRERVKAALSHQQPDRVPVDFGGTVVTGIHAAALDRLRKALGLAARPVKVFEPMMMLGLVEDDVRQALGSDVVGLCAPSTLLGYRNENWKPWTLPDGTEVLMGGGFAVTYGPDGTAYAYPGGNTSVPPSAKMPANGFYFDNIVRQDDLSEHIFNARMDYADQYGVFSDEDCQYYEETSRALYEETDCALFGNFFLGGVGDIFHIPGAWLEHPRGIRDLQGWLMAHYDYPGYIRDFFDMQAEITLKNLELYRQAVGDRIVAIGVSGTDFGAQHGPFISPDCYREFYKPYHKMFNDWVHRHTSWKVLFHSCGSIAAIMDDLIESGVDVINPVQFTAAHMDLQDLKARYGDRVAFWGGGVDPQKTLPFGTPQEVARETQRNVRILSAGGGYVCGTVHNIQAPTPVENIIAFFEAIHA
jgi:hypothetical protein